MPGYLLDTNILSDLVHRPRSGTAARQLALVRARGGQDVWTSIIAAAELRYGVAKRGSPRLARSRRFSVRSKRCRSRRRPT